MVVFASFFCCNQRRQVQHQIAAKTRQLNLRIWRARDSEFGAALVRARRFRAVQIDELHQTRVLERNRQPRAILSKQNASDSPLQTVRKRLQHLHWTLQHVAVIIVFALEEPASK